eukprot:gene6061-9317_t
MLALMLWGCSAWAACGNVQDGCEACGFDEAPTSCNGVVKFPSTGEGELKCTTPSGCSGLQVDCPSNVTGAGCAVECRGNGTCVDTQVVCPVNLPESTVCLLTCLGYSCLSNVVFTGRFTVQCDDFSCSPELIQLINGVDDKEGGSPWLIILILLIVVILCLAAMVFWLNRRKFPTGHPGERARSEPLAEKTPPAAAAADPQQLYSQNGVTLYEQSPSQQQQQQQGFAAGPRLSAVDPDRSLLWTSQQGAPGNPPVRYASSQSAFNASQQGTQRGGGLAATLSHHGNLVYTSSQQGNPMYTSSQQQPQQQPQQVASPVYEPPGDVEAYDPAAVTLESAGPLLQQEADAPQARVLKVPKNWQEVKAAVDWHPSCEWNEKYRQGCGKRGEVVGEDAYDGTVLLRFVDPDAEAWYPMVLFDIEEYRERFPPNLPQSSTASCAGYTYRLQKNLRQAGRPYGFTNPPSKRRGPEVPSA